MPTLGAGSGTPQEGVDDDDDEVDGDGKRKRPALRHSDVLEQAGSSEDEDDDEEDRTASAASAPKPSAVSSQPAGPMPYDRRDTLTGAPEPLAPELVTLSLLPRSQWQSLVHLEAIKARNRSVSCTCVRGQRGCVEV